MGNEVLHSQSPGSYPKVEGERQVRVKEHTVNRVLGCLDAGINPPRGSRSIEGLNAGDVFCGYLMLDALISNQDRHHENWAIIVDNDTGERYLCPTYDHAASLGRELRDTERQERLTTRDRNRSVTQFVSKARSELFRLKTDKKRLLTIDAFYSAIEKRHAARSHWLTKLELLSDTSIMSILDSVPTDLISAPARAFALQMILENKKRLIEDERK